MKQTSAIIYVITKLELGGAQKVCLSLFNQIPDAHTTTYIITSSDGMLLKSLLPHAQIILIPGLRREVKLLSSFQELKVAFFLINTLRRLKKKHSQCIVHTHSTKAGLMGRWAAFFARIPQRVHTVHGFAFHAHQSWFSWSIIYFFELITSFITTKFIFVSQKDASYAIRLFPKIKHKTKLIRAAVQQQLFLGAQKAKFSATFTFGTIACFKPQKNIFDLLQAFQIAYHQNNALRLEIIGDGILRPHIENWISGQNLSHVITLHGWQQNVVAFMQRWQAFVLSSLWEGLPCAIIEARLLQLPVIAYKTGGIGEVIMHENNGLLYDQKDYVQLAQGMLRISTDQQLWKKLSSYHDTLEPFYTETMIDEHQNLYKQLLTK